MALSLTRRRFEQALAEAGVTLNGTNPWDIQVKDRRLLRRAVLAGFEGFVNAYVDGWWECDAIDQLYERLLGVNMPARLWFNLPTLRRYVFQKLFNLQKPRGAFRNVRAHYNLGNDLFRAMLDSRLTYSCGYWEGAESLEEAQEAKLELICRKLRLEPGMRVLDIGSGWGSFVRYAAERYGCEVTGITLSSEQVHYSRGLCADLPVEIRLQDYRDMDEVFDRIVSVGMFEHVGQKNHRTFMQAVHRCLTPDGLCLLHFFATQRAWPNLTDTEAVWVTKNIFPGLVVPTLGQVGAAADGLFVIEDLHNFGQYYDPTLMAWFENFHRNWEALRQKYGGRFYRMWKHYLLSCAGAFRSRKYQVWQIVLSPKGVVGGYRPVRGRVPLASRAEAGRVQEIAV